MALGTMLPEHHLEAESKDLIKVAMGLIGTMSALVLGLLVTSAKNSFDMERNGLAQLAGNVMFLDYACRWPLSVSCVCQVRLWWRRRYDFESGSESKGWRFVLSIRFRLRGRQRWVSIPLAVAVGIWVVASSGLPIARGEEINGVQLARANVNLPDSINRTAILIPNRANLIGVAPVRVEGWTHEAPDITLSPGQLTVKVDFRIRRDMDHDPGFVAGGIAVVGTRIEGGVPRGAWVIIVAVRWIVIVIAAAIATGAPVAAAPAIPAGTDPSSPAVPWSVPTSMPVVAVPVVTVPVIAVPVVAIPVASVRVASAPVGSVGCANVAPSSMPSASVASTTMACRGWTDRPGCKAQYGQ
jgi:hypothetical protein